MQATDAGLCDTVIDPRTTPDDVRNVWKEVVKVLAALIHIRRDVNAANYWALLCDTLVRIAPTADNSVFVCGSEGLQRSVVAFDLSRMV